MNQILYTDDDKFNSSKNNKKRSKSTTTTNKANIKSIIIFFSIIMMIMGLLMVSGGVYANIRNSQEDNQSVSNEPTKPALQIERVDDSTITIYAKHDKEIKDLVYSWNGENAVTVEGKGEKELEINDIEIPNGSNKFNVKVTDINDITTIYEQNYDGGTKATITLEQVTGNVNLTVECENKIKTVTYYWDENEEESEVLEINDVKTQTLITPPEQGEHELYVEVEDELGNITKKHTTIKAVIAPEVEVTTDGVDFIIKATDENGLTKIKINLNGETTEEEIDGKEWNKNIPLVDGENKLIVTVYNKEDIIAKSKVKYTKE